MVALELKDRIVSLGLFICLAVNVIDIITAFTTKYLFYIYYVPCLENARLNDDRVKM